LIHVFVFVFIISFVGMIYTIYDTEDLDGIPVETLEDIERGIRFQEMHVRHGPMMARIHHTMTKGDIKEELEKHIKEKAEE